MSSYNYLDKTGLAEVWAKIKDYAAPETVVVTVTGNETDGYTADKTYAELRDANVAKKQIFLKYSSYTFYLWGGPKTATSTMFFTFGTLVGGNEYYFTISYDTVSRPTLRSVRTVNGKTGSVSLGILDLNDANIISPADGHMLVYDSETSKWVNEYVVEDDIEVLNMLAEFGYATPVTDADGKVIVDADNNAILG